MSDDPRLHPFVLQDYTFEAVGERGYMPVVPVGFYGLSSDESMEVVGESKYQEDIHRVVTAWRRAGSDQGQLYALLFAEPGNPFDHNAVRVLLIFEGHHATCGYLPREQARSFAAPVRQAADQGLIAALHAQVFGGTPEKPNYGVWLGLPSEEYGEDGMYRG